MLLEMLPPDNSDNFIGKDPLSKMMPPCNFYSFIGENFWGNFQSKSSFSFRLYSRKTDPIVRLVWLCVVMCGRVSFRHGAV